jgi:hypothetical protein
VSEKETAGEAESREILRTRIDAWWLSVLAGQVQEAHPVQGTHVKARMEGNTLILSGTVPSEADRQEIDAEIQHLRQHGVEEVRDELEVVPEVTDEPGLLMQTLMATFETAEQAGFAEGYLEGHAHIRPGLMKVIGADSAEAGRSALRAVLPEAYWEDAEEALEAGRALLVVTVDETEAFKARELLDEETHSLETLVLPPQPAQNLGSSRRDLDQVPPEEGSRHVDEEAESGRRSALKKEGSVHGS